MLLYLALKQKEKNSWSLSIYISVPIFLYNLCILSFQSIGHSSLMFFSLLSMVSIELRLRICTSQNRLDSPSKGPASLAYVNLEAPLLGGYDYPMREIWTTCNSQLVPPMQPSIIFKATGNASSWWAHIGAFPILKVVNEGYRLRVHLDAHKSQ